MRSLSLIEFFSQKNFGSSPKISFPIACVQYRTKRMTRGGDKARLKIFKVDACETSQPMKYVPLMRADHPLFKGGAQLSQHTRSS